MESYFNLQGSASLQSLLLFGGIVAGSATQTKTLRFRENTESPMTLVSNNVGPMVTSELLLSTHELFFENSADHSETVCSHRIKYIFKSSSLKYSEVIHYYLYLIEEILVRSSKEAPSLRPEKKQPLPPYKHSRQQLKNQSAAGFVPRGEVSLPFPTGICVLTTKQCSLCGIQSITAADPALPMPGTNQSPLLSLTHTLFLSLSLSLSLSQQRFSGLNSESFKPVLIKIKFRKSFEDHLWFPHYTSWQIPQDDDAVASTNCRLAPASPCSCSCITKQQHLQTSSSFTKQQHLYHPSPQATTLLQLAPALRDHIHSFHPS